ncbi:MAG TPA: winged helix-turn-helix domain-containing protein [Thermoanaerobaculia bacterium]|nr:winged helix-turn-helix domain-containing protein [Thermoanaerobaculia bacterium]
MEQRHSGGELDLAEWRVQPSLNRLTRGDVTVRIEPKLMDVLLFLVRHAGQVVSKDAIAGAVWPELFITESVITRAIAGLRRAFEDDVRAPRFIETIAKRGYRLLIPPVAAAPERPSGRALPSAAGQWVRGERFHGRSAEIAEVLDGHRNGVWLLGGRTIGKTSLLKQLEYLTASDSESRYFPLFWDLQGSVEPDDLHTDFRAALTDAEERLSALGIRLEEIAAGDFFTALGGLRRALRARGRTLLLLWDEVEELIHLHAKSPALLRKLRRALQSQEGIRTVIASGPRLWKLAEQRDDTSPFLHGFAPPLYLGPLQDEAARGLVRQLQGRAAAIDDKTVAEILRCCGNHPSLLQMLCARAHELGDLEQATESVAADPTVRFFFAVDFDLLTLLEQEVLLAVARREARPEDQAALLHLERLGLVRRSEAGTEIASPILRQWLREKTAQNV